MRNSIHKFGEMQWLLCNLNRLLRVCVIGDCYRLWCCVISNGIYFHHREPPAMTSRFTARVVLDLTSDDEDAHHVATLPPRTTHRLSMNQNMRQKSSLVELRARPQTTNPPLPVNGTGSHSALASPQSSGSNTVERQLAPSPINFFGRGRSCLSPKDHFLM